MATKEIKNRPARSDAQKQALFDELSKAPIQDKTGKAWTVTSTSHTGRIVDGQHLKPFGSIAVYGEYVSREIQELQSLSLVAIQAGIPTSAPSPKASPVSTSKTLVETPASTKK